MFSYIFFGLTSLVLGSAETNTLTEPGQMDFIEVVTISTPINDNSEKDFTLKDAYTCVVNIASFPLDK